MTGVVAADEVAELAAGLPALFVQCAAVLGCEAEARRPRPTREWPAHMGKWVIHRVLLVSGKVAPDALPIRRRYIGNYRYARSEFRAGVLPAAVCGRQWRGSTSPMSQENVRREGRRADLTATHGRARWHRPRQRVRLWVNWALALLDGRGRGRRDGVRIGCRDEHRRLQRQGVPQPGAERDQLRRAVLRRAGGGCRGDRRFVLHRTATMGIRGPGDCALRC